MTTIDFVRTLIEHGFKEDWPNFVAHPYAKHMLWRPLKGATELPPCSSNEANLNLFVNVYEHPREKLTTGELELVAGIGDGNVWAKLALYGMSAEDVLAHLDEHEARLVRAWTAVQNRNES